MLAGSSQLPMPSLALVILLLSLSIEAWSGRALNLGNKDSTMPSYDLSKDDDKASLLLKHLKEGSKVSEVPGGAKEAVEVKRETISGAVPVLSHGKVSWSAARKNRGKYPGFHVDYVGPRTHPPAHN